MKELPVEVFDLLDRKYHILAHWNFLEFDQNFDILRENLSLIKKDQFDSKDRIIIEHQDTDFYIKECTIGMNLRNFFCVVSELDIPFYLFIFYTNHFGIQKEFDIICKHRHPLDRPTVIESFLSTLHHDKNKIAEIECNFDSIQVNMLCMMNLKRSHRNAVYNELKDIDDEKLALAGTNAYS
jgi:hypothetical protein